MKNVFKPVQYIRKSFFQRLFKQEPTVNAVINLNNLLAKQDVLSIDSTLISEIESKYRVDLKSDFSLNLQEFYAVYWNEYLKSGSKEDMQKVAHMASIFNLSTENVYMLHTKIGEIWYRTASANAVAKKRLNKDDRIQLDLLKVKLNLPDKVAAVILNEAEINVVNKQVSKLVAKKRCSPDEETELNTMLINFDIPDAAARQIHLLLAPLKNYWLIENLPLTPIVANTVVQKSELCYFEIDMVKWLETRSAGYGNKQLEVINEGTVYLTNKRLLFVGKVKNSIITYDRIVKLSANSSGVTIHKDKGKNPVLSFLKDGEIFEIMFNRLFRGI